MLQEKVFYPQGVCSKVMTMKYDGHKIISLKIEGGCSGNSQGVCRLCEGQDMLKIKDLLKGIRCGNKETSCPDQLALLIESIFDSN